MPLPPSTQNRQPLHTRNVRINSFERDDGQWDLEAELVDTKAYDFPKRFQDTHKAGEPVHHIHLRVTIDHNFTITDAVAAYDAAPYDQHCTSIAPSYENLIGLNLLKNFKERVKERFARVAGCTHLSELSYVLPTVAVQTMSNQRRHEAETGTPDGKRPFQLDGCHALSVKGPVVKTFYPKWYVAPPAEAECDQ